MYVICSVDVVVDKEDVDSVPVRGWLVAVKVVLVLELELPVSVKLPLVAE